MAGTRRTDLLGKLADLSDDAMQRLSDAPGGERLVGAINATRERVDDLQKRVRGMDDLEKRLAALERKVDKLAKASAGGSRSSKPTSTKQS
jgi:hypothetical protein